MEDTVDLHCTSSQWRCYWLLTTRQCVWEWGTHITVTSTYRELMYHVSLRFNSFTQQVCINDAVKPEGGKISAAERDLRPQYKLGTMIAVDGGNVDISQDVSWTAKFVDRISEVTDSMNVSGMSFPLC